MKKMIPQQKSSKKKSVLILNFPYASTFGGGEKHTLQLIDHLPYHFFALTTCQALLPELRKRKIITRTCWMPKEPVTATAAGAFFFLWPIALVQLLYHIIRMKKQYNINILYCLSLTEKIVITPWARLLGMKVVWMEHAPIGRWLFLNPWRVLYCVWSRYVILVTVSDVVAEQLNAVGVKKSSIRVIPNGIEEKFFDLASPPFYRKGQPLQLLFVGRLSEEKGIYDLVSAMRELLTHIPQAQLRIVGDGPCRESLEQMIIEQGVQESVQVCGFSFDVVSEVERAHIVVVPSHKEAFGLSAAEALAAKRPVVVTRVGALPDLVQQEEWLVDPNAPRQLADAILHIEVQYSDALKKAAHHAKRIKKVYTQTQMLKQYEQLFEQL